MQNQIITTPVGGLGNRLLTIFAAIAYTHIEQYDKLVIRWTNNSHCPINLNEVLTITNTPHDIVDSPIYDTTPTPYPKITHLYGNSHTYETTARTSETTPEQVFEWVRCNLHSHIDLVPVSPIILPDIALHCRRSDWGATVNDPRSIISNIRRDRIILDIEFEKYVRPIIDGRSPVFLSTDSPRTEEVLLREHPHIVIQRKTKYPIDTTRTPLLIKEALVDLMTLAYAKMIIRDSQSTFSMVAHLLALTKHYHCQQLTQQQVPQPSLITWDRPVLREAGPGFTQLIEK